MKNMCALQFLTLGERKRISHHYQEQVNEMIWEQKCITKVKLNQLKASLKNFVNCVKSYFASKFKC